MQEGAVGVVGKGQYFTGIQGTGIEWIDLAFHEGDGLGKGLTGIDKMNHLFGAVRCRQVQPDGATAYHEKLPGRLLALKQVLALLELDDLCCFQQLRELLVIKPAEQGVSVQLVRQNFTCTHGASLLNPAENCICQMANTGQCEHTGCLSECLFQRGAE